MGRSRRIARHLGIFCLIALAGFWLGLAPHDRSVFPGNGQALVQIHVVDHGWHTGIVIAQPHLRAAALRLGRADPDAAARVRWIATRFPDADWLEIGWGDQAFYQSTATIDDMDAGLALRALFLPTSSVLQVVPGWADPKAAFSRSTVLQLDLSDAGFDRLVTRLAETIPEPVPRDQSGGSLYGLGSFYPAALDYHLFRTCNHWVSWLLRGAGVPSSFLPATFSNTLALELEWRRKWGI